MDGVSFLWVTFSVTSEWALPVYSNLTETSAPFAILWEIVYFPIPLLILHFQVSLMHLRSTLTWHRPCKFIGLGKYILLARGTKYYCPGKLDSIFFGEYISLSCEKQLLGQWIWVIVVYDNTLIAWPSPVHRDANGSHTHAGWCVMMHPRVRTHFAPPESCALRIVHRSGEPRATDGRCWAVP